MTENGEGAGAGSGAGAAGPGGSATLAWLGGIAAVVAIGGAAWLMATRPVAVAPDTGAAPGAAIPATVPATVPAAPAPAATPAPAPAPASETPAPPLPAFDTVRAETDGSVIVAGRASAGSEVVIAVNGAEAARAKADGQGRFATFLTLVPGADPNLMTLAELAPDGTQRPADGTVILAPIAAPPAAPVVTAATETATAPAAPPTGTAAAPVAVPLVAVPLVADSTGVRKLDAGAAATVVVDTISYDAAGDVLIDGRATGAGAARHVRLYLDNAEVATAPVTEAGTWTARLTAIAPRLYTLRVDQLDAAGKVVSRFETPFLREAPDVVASAVAPPASAPATAVAAATQPAATQPAATQPAATESATTAPVAQDTPPAAPATQARILTVQPGFTLWGIARKNYGDGMLYVKVFEANKNQIRDPDLIYPGQVFTVPAQ